MLFSSAWWVHRVVDPQFVPSSRSTALLLLLFTVCTRVIYSSCVSHGPPQLPVPTTRSNYPFIIYDGVLAAHKSAQLHSPPLILTPSHHAHSPCSLTTLTHLLTHHPPSPPTAPATITTPALTSTATAFTITTAALEPCRISPTPRRPSRAHPRLPWGGGRRGACRTRCPGSTTT